MLQRDDKTLKIRLSVIKSLEHEKDTDDNKYLLLIIDNITKKKKIENLKRKYEFESNLISSFSHELRTPLNANL